MKAWLRRLFGVIDPDVSNEAAYWQGYADGWNSARTELGR